MALVVLVLQVLVLVALALTPGEPPAMRMALLERLWAAARQPTFYPLIALLIGGPVLTLLALRMAGRHQAWLAMGWCGFAFVLMIAFGHRVAVMLDVLWWYANR